MFNYTIFENHSYNDDSTKLFGGTTYICQTFTPGTAHTIYVIEMNLIRIGACGTVTMNLYATDIDGKPTGASLATGIVGQTQVGLTAGVQDFFLTVPYMVGGEKLAIVLSAAGALGTIGARYKNVGVYTAGGVFSSTDSGVTWTETELSDFIFSDWGIELPIYNATVVQLYPRKEGTYTQLQPLNTAPNWQQVADPVDSPDEEGSYVAFNVSDSEGFMTGESDGAAGVLSGTSVFWKSNSNGLWGDGTTFDTELNIGYLLKSPNKNEFFPEDWKRIVEVSSIEGAGALSLKKHGDDATKGEYNACGAAWFFTPATSAEATAGKITVRNEGYTLPMAYLDGTWTWTNGSKVVSGSGGNAATIFPDTNIHPYAARGYLGTGTSERTNTGTAYPIDTVDSENQITLQDKFKPDSPPGTTENLADMTKYCFFGYSDDLTDEDKATMWTTKTKKDSYLIKQTQIAGQIRKLDVVFRCAVTDTDRQTTCKIATYDSSDKDKAESTFISKSTYTGTITAAECPSLCGTLSNSTGTIANAPISIIKTWDTMVTQYGETYQPPTYYYPEVTAGGTFQLVVEPNMYVYFGKLDAMDISGDLYWYGLFGEGTYDFTITGTGTLSIMAWPKILKTYTDTEIAIATWNRINEAMNAYNRVIFCPGTWKVDWLNPWIGNYIVIGTNLEASHDTTYNITADICDGSNDEVQWNEGLQGHTVTRLYGNVSGYVLEDYVVAGRNTRPLSNTTATAQPFLVLNGTTSLGTEETVYVPKPIGNTYEYPEYQFITFRQSISRPGGGPFTIDDLENLEVGIILGNLSDFNNIHKVLCTQLYADLYVSATPWLRSQTIGMTQYGFKAYINRLDEWGLPVFSNGMNMLTHKIYIEKAPFFARPMQLLRGITSRFLGRRRTSSSPRRDKTSGSITQ
jgi:hypothetical protein